MVLRDRRVIVAALVSAKDVGATSFVDVVCERVRQLGWIVTGTVVQRRGVSRGSHPGGASKMSAPLSPATYLGSGKVEELRAMRESAAATLVVVCNPLSASQRERLAEMVGADVIVDTDLHQR